MFKLHRPSPALVVALVALFVSLSGTAVAAGVPLAKRALFANNAGKLQGKTARQIEELPGPATTLNGFSAEDIARQPSPASTASSLVSSGSAPFALAPSEEKDFSAQCPSFAKAVSGGFTTPDDVLATDTRPTADGAGWTLFLINLSASQSATGNVQVVCLS
ncbi:MAG TPA: hypothetical protein VFL41_11010 [Gaiellaceae bacterium]|nr:hypothetical protein [Gaiellaceae bacterium]